MEQSKLDSSSAVLSLSEDKTQYHQSLRKCIEQFTSNLLATRTTSLNPLHQTSQFSPKPPPQTAEGVKEANQSQRNSRNGWQTERKFTSTRGTVKLSNSQTKVAQVKSKINKVLLSKIERSYSPRQVIRTPLKRGERESRERKERTKNGGMRREIYLEETPKRKRAPLVRSSSPFSKQKPTSPRANNPIHSTGQLKKPKRITNRYATKPLSKPRDEVPSQLLRIIENNQDHRLWESARPSSPEQPLQVKLIDCRETAIFEEWS